MSERTLHIVLYSGFPNVSGGRENWVYHIARQMQDSFSRVVIYSFVSDPPSYYHLNAYPHVEIVRVRSLQNVMRWRRNIVSRTLHKVATLVDMLYAFPNRVARQMALRVDDGDVVLAMNPIIESSAAIRLRQMTPRRFSVFCSVRGHVVEELTAFTRIPLLRFLFAACERASLLDADRVLANGQDTKAYLTSRGYDSTTIPNGVDVARFANPVDPFIPHPVTELLRDLKREGHKIVCALGSLRDIKGTNELIKCIPELKALCKQKIKFVFVGNGDPQSFRELASELGVIGETEFVGEQAEVPPILALADYAACVSYGSGMSMAALECMAAGKAIVAWNSDVYRPFLREGETALLVKERDHLALARAFADLIASPGQAAALGKAAQADSWAYDWRVVVESLGLQMNAAGTSTMRTN